MQLCIRRADGWDLMLLSQDLSWLMLGPFLEGSEQAETWKMAKVSLPWATPSMGLSA